MFLLSADNILLSLRVIPPALYSTPYGKILCSSCLNFIHFSYFPFLFSPFHCSCRSTAGYCLLDEPAKALTSPTDLPGRRYTLDQQCKLWMGPQSSFCPYGYARGDLCQRLWCRLPSANCKTFNVPAAAGTPCGRYQRSGVVSFDCHDYAGILARYCPMRIQVCIVD